MKTKRLVKIIIGILIILFVLLLISKALIVYDYKNSLKDSHIDKNMIFNNSLNIKHENGSYKTIVFEKLEFKDFFEDYVEINNNGYKAKVKYDEKGNVSSSFTITKNEQIINLLSFNSLKVISEDEQEDIDFSTDKYMKKFLNKHNIKDDVDLLNYYKNSKLDYNILKTRKVIKRNYLFNSVFDVYFPEFDNIVLLKGDLRGYIINVKSTIEVKEITLINNNDKYVISLIGDDLTNDDFVNELLRSIRFV